MLTSKLKQRLIEEDFWNMPCIHSGEFGVEAEHALFYGRKQIQERWAIVPVARRFNRNPHASIKQKSELYAMNQAKRWGLWEEIKERYPKKDWDTEYDLLLGQYQKD